jgi:hypothetical protein
VPFQEKCGEEEEEEDDDDDDDDDDENKSPLTKNKLAVDRQHSCYYTEDKCLLEDCATTRDNSEEAMDEGYDEKVSVGTIGKIDTLQ